MPRGTSVYDEARVQRRLWHPNMLRPGVLAARYNPFEPNATLLTPSIATSISDLSGNGYTETAGSSGSQPGYVTNAINGVAVLSFNGLSQWVVSNLSAAPAGDRTFIVVFKPAASATHTLFGAASSGGLQFRINGTTLNLLKEFVANIGSSTTTVAVGVTSILVGYYNQSTGAYSFRINGADAGGSGTNVQTLSASTTTVGRNPAAGSEYAQGQMGEHVALNTISSDDLQRYEGFLSQVYAVTLASGHPYAAGPPSGWTPNSLPSGTLAARYVPSDPSTVQQISPPLLATLRDASGNGFDETGSSGTQPGFTVNSLNGAPTLVFTGTQFVTSNLSASPADRTFIALYRPSATSTQTIFGSVQNGGLQFRLESNNALGFVKEGVAAIGSTTVTVPVNAWALVVGSYNQASGAYSFRLNGKAVGSGTNVQTLTANTTTVVGKNPPAGGEFANGTLGEHVALTAPTLNEIINYEGKIAWDAGLANQVLDPSHPRRARPPLIGD